MQQLSPDSQQWVQRWLRKADGDLRAAEKLAESPEFFSEVAFHCQQAAEKYLKAWLTAEQRLPPRTHDLEKLVYMVADFTPLGSDDERLATFLTPYAVLSRYPADDDDSEPAVSELLSAAYHFRDRFRPALAEASNTGPYPAN
ncbi:HEPN domain-containing protein [Hymenobacter metallilatus]|uniref:HEPN domain-containing protein n=1 Tax=Hymenobacter metallilatus TaxID=2493666 RepID=A0A3R9MP96_9BACT|nr:HEPN domain-containing protein [Hymenobacter metallilatus]RSK37330.1 HEPN domain-containing protein [Hymenobacter metallilatus]